MAQCQNMEVYLHVYESLGPGKGWLEQLFSVLQYKAKTLDADANPDDIYFTGQLPLKQGA